jgi:hypothetical protein
MTSAPSSDSPVNGNYGQTVITFSDGLVPLGMGPTNYSLHFDTLFLSADVADRYLKIN